MEQLRDFSFSFTPDSGIRNKAQTNDYIFIDPSQGMPHEFPKSEPRGKLKIQINLFGSSSLQPAADGD